MVKGVLAKNKNHSQTEPVDKNVTDKLDVKTKTTKKRKPHKKKTLTD